MQSTYKTRWLLHFRCLAAEMLLCRTGAIDFELVVNLFTSCPPIIELTAEKLDTTSGVSDGKIF